MLVLPGVTHLMEQGRKNFPQRAVKVASVDVDIFFYPKTVSAIHIMTPVLYAFPLKRYYWRFHRLVFEKGDVEERCPPVKL